jgi:tetratricopeptide (TPR) repeat protein
MRIQAGVLNNLGDVLQATAPAEAEAALRRALGLLEVLAARPSATLTDRHYLAAAELNLGDALRRRRALPEAEAILARAEADYEKLVVTAPRSIDFRAQLAMAQGYLGAALAESGRLDAAADALARAIGHQDRAVQLGRNRQDVRAALVGLLFDRAGVNLRRGADQEAADDALRAPRVAAESGRGEAYLGAARILARLVGRVGADPGLVPADRERRIRPYLGHAIVLVREALDSDPKLAARIKEDADLKTLGSRPEFKTTLSALIDPGH